MIEPCESRIEALGDRCLHVVIDMQRLFAEATVWHTPALTEILPAVVRLATARRRDTIFARFVTPSTPAEASGRWRRYYERWRGVTGAEMPDAMLDLVPTLQALAAPGTIFDKPGYSIFSSPSLVARLTGSGIDTLILSGVETDVCVLASVLDAVDRGYRVIVPVDAVASSAPASHEATLTHVLPRLPEQVDLATVDEILGAWAPA